MGHRNKITRRDFLRLAGASLGGLALPHFLPGLIRATTIWSASLWPILHPTELPDLVQEVLNRLPPLRVGPDGYVYPLGALGGERLGRVPVAPTRWNLENRRPYHRLYENMRWGIVLHWFGERPDHHLDLSGYLRGFDSLREIDGIDIRTSTHFLVGEAAPIPEPQPPKAAIGIIQTQQPDLDGVPFLGSHLQPIDKVAHIARQQYFVRALYQLSYDEPAVHSLLQDMYDGRYLDANMRTIGIEIAGSDFENPEHFPSPQKIANTLALVWALMKRYDIPAENLLGHMEIQLNKPDPGKKFMALMRYLIGLLGLLRPDYQMRMLIFGRYMTPGVEPLTAVYKYFKFTRDFLALTGAPRRVYEWEGLSRYWHTFERLFGREHPVSFVRELSLPVAGAATAPQRVFMDPQNHEGVDLYEGEAGPGPKLGDPPETRLIADGVCLYAGKVRSCAQGLGALFRHFLPDGTQVLSVYNHLESLGDITVGQLTPRGFPVGRVARAHHPWEDEFFHFALAYGSMWDTQFVRGPDIPLNVGPTWIEDRYLPPVTFISQLNARLRAPSAVPLRSE